MKKLWKKIKDAFLAWVERNVVADDPYDMAQENAKESKPTETVAKEASATKQDNADAVTFSSLDWKWGGFSASGAKSVDGARIASLEVSKDGLSYKWAKGGCEKLGASSASDASCVACLFCRIGGKWIGGKFDWISTSRKTRDFKNISDGYNGWDKGAVSKADAFVFVIVSKDGSRRTNVITQNKKARQ